MINDKCLQRSTLNAQRSTLQRWRHLNFIRDSSFVIRHFSTMSAYVIVEIEIIDPIGYEEYKKQAAATVHKYGGKYIVRGGKTEVLEGDWHPKRLVILQFESMQRAKEWLHCEEYREPRKLRHRTAKTKMVLVEGV